MPTIEAIAAIESPIIENPLPDETLSDAIAASDKPKSTKRSAKSKTESKYTRDRLNALKINEIRKTYRVAVPHGDRNSEKHTKAEYATRDFMIDAILMSGFHS